MKKEFDPYYKWLGIPPKDQPPTHYRLLGIELFEEDRDVIDAAANRVMAYLKDLAVGDEAEYSQKLLNEVSRARLCLLNREKKAAYDQGLRAKLATEAAEEGRAEGGNGEARERRPPEAAKPPARRPKPAEAKPPAKPPVKPPPAEPAIAPPLAGLQLGIDIGEPASLHGRRRKPRDSTGAGQDSSSSNSTIKIVLAVLALLLVGGGLAVAVWMNRESAKVASNSGSETPQGTAGSRSEPATPNPPAATDPAGTSQPKKTRPNGKPGAGPDGDGPDTDPWAGTELAKLPPLVPGSRDPDNPFDVPPTTVPPDGMTPPTISNPADPFADPPSGLPKIELPERPDLVNPTENPPDPTAKPAPSNPSPQPAAKPELPTSLGPFRDLPQHVALPPLPTDGQPSAKVLGRVYLQPDDLCLIKLRGGETAVRAGSPLLIRNANNGLAEHDWELLLRPGGNGQETLLASMSLDGQSQLNFQWQAEAASQPAAANLANCALSLSAHGSSHVLALREATAAEPMEIDLDKPTPPKDDWKIDNPPDPSTLRVEILGLDGLHHQVQPKATIAADGGEAWVELADVEGLLQLKVTTSFKRSLQVEALPHLKVKPDARPERFLVRRMPQLLASVSNEAQNVLMVIEQSKQLLRNASGQERQMIEQRQRVAEQMLPLAEYAVQRWQKLDEQLKQHDNKLKLHFRLFCETDATQIELLHAGDPEKLPPPPEDNGNGARGGKPRPGLPRRVGDAAEKPGP